MTASARSVFPVVAAMALLCACATSKPVAIPADDLGLQKGPVLATPVPPRLVVNETAPGDAPLPPRAWVGVAPVVPHAVGDFLPITAKENACVGCHQVATKEKGGPTPLPRSHFVDFRNAPDKVQARLVDTRYVCVSCHVEGTGAKPLVRNDLTR
jgi:cytochrome c-type protein NapB